MNDRRQSTYRLKQIGSQRIGWAIEIDGVVRSSHPSAQVLGAWLDAHLKGASSHDCDDIARAIEKRPPPTYEERLAVFAPSGRPEPSRDPFRKRGE